MTHPDGTFDAYTFNYSGRLLQKVQGGVTIRYAYSSGLAPLAEYNVNTGQWTNHIMANGKIWAMETGNQVKYLHHDAIGNVVAISDQSGTVIDKFVYDPFGKMLSHTGTTQTDYGFVGSYGVRQMPDGMMLMGRRLYDPTAGRFTTPDPLGFGGGDYNFYRYCGNNSIGFVDPEGLTRYRGESIYQAVEREANAKQGDVLKLMDNLGYYGLASAMVSTATSLVSTLVSTAADDIVKSSSTEAARAGGNMIERRIVAEEASKDAARIAAENAALKIVSVAATAVGVLATAFSITARLDVLPDCLTEDESPDVNDTEKKKSNDTNNN